MDGFAFDRLSRTLSAQPTRRRLLGLLTALPLAGLVVTQADELTSAAGRGHKSKKGHHSQGKSNLRPTGNQTGQNPGPGQCTPAPLTATCAGQCGSVVNNCGTSVDCGPCACGASCPPCQTCDATTGH